ncbi:MAG: alpha/beta fold hydrolase [Albidovulum sp.]
MLNLTTFGNDSGKPPLLIAHGLFGSARNWGAIARRLADDRRVTLVDMRNHGDSFWSEIHDYPSLAADLAAVIGADHRQMDLLGHSMGGKAAMMLALLHPELVNRLIVADIAPVAYDHSLNHLITAMRGLDLAGLTSRLDANRLLASGVPEDGTRAFLLQSLDLKSEPPRWRLNLDVLDAEMARITGWPDTQGRFDGPSLFLTGALSDYVLAEHRATIKALFPAAIMAKIPGAGHWLHAEKPREFEAAIRAFLT